KQIFSNSIWINIKGFGVFIPFLRPAIKNERECGAAGEIRPRMELEGAADLRERVDPGRGSGEKERPLFLS
ncbi:MAG: hypothetical protein II184_08025, partial [Clostridia bacterium]|nr:hypothetical protein [Clostridia bacterium]